MDNDRGQSLITKYVWVIETIYRRRKISFKELNELWLRGNHGVGSPDHIQESDISMLYYLSHSHFI